jgi:hypothetical protein
MSAIFVSPAIANTAFAEGDDASAPASASIDTVKASEVLRRDGEGAQAQYRDDINASSVHRVPAQAADMYEREAKERKADYSK